MEKPRLAVIAIVLALLAAAVLAALQGRNDPGKRYSASPAPASEEEIGSVAGMIQPTRSPSENEVRAPLQQNLPSHTLSARLLIEVIDPGGQPLAEAEVDLTALEGNTLRASEVTGSAGRAQFPDLVAGIYAMKVSHRLHAPRYVSRVVHDAGAERVVRVQLAEGWRLSGRVENLDGSPAAHVGVGVGPISRWTGEMTLPGWTRSASSNEGGEFFFEGLPLEAVTITARDEKSLGEVIVSEPVPSVVIVRLGTKPLLQGQVMELGSGAPVSGAELIDRVDGLTCATTTADGEFQFVSSSGSPATYTVASKRHVTTACVLDSMGRATVFLARRVNVVLRALDESEVPMAGARVDLISMATRMPSGLPWRAEFRLDEQGMAAVRPDIPADVYGITLHRDEAGTFEFASVSLEAGEEPTRVDLRVPFLRNVAGKVTSADGLPLPGVLITALASVPGGEPVSVSLPEFRGRTDAGGTFSLHLTPGPWHLRFEKAGYQSRSREVSIVDPDAECHILEVLRSGSPMRGVVVDTFGVGVAGASLWIADSTRCDETLTDQGGTFLAPWATEELCLVQAWAKGYATKMIRDVPGDTQELEIKLSACGRICGLVVAEASGLPVEEFAVGLSRLDSSGDEFSSTLANMTLSVRSRSGRFVLDELQSGPWNIEVHAGGFAPWKGAAYCGAKEQDEEVVVTLRESVGMKGIVRHLQRGTPIENATVKLLEKPELNKPGRVVTATSTTEEGAFELSGFGPGEYLLLTEHEGFIGDRRMVAVDAQSVSFPFLRCDLAPAVSFFGTVFDAEGRSVAGANVFVQGTTSFGSNIWQFTSSNEAGHYELSGVELDREFILTGTRKGTDGVVRRTQRRIAINADGQEVSLVLK